MLDISIKELRKVLTSEKKRTEFLTKHIVVTEKFDGTKLTLIRNDQPYNPYDYTKNWIVAYKGNVLFREEYDGIDNQRFRTAVTPHSIGTSQYGLVHLHLVRVHQRCAGAPCNTEFFVEFIQNKPTLTRDYEVTHDMFLLGYAPCNYILRGQRVVTSTGKLETTQRQHYADLLDFKVSPVLFEGPASVLGNVDAIVSRYSDFQSSLRGKAEGVVIEAEDGELYKVVSPDQYDKEYRKQRKSRWTLDDEGEKTYWTVNLKQAEQLVTGITTIQPDTRGFLSELSRTVYSLSPDELETANPKKALVVKQDDLFLTAKMLHERRSAVPLGTKKVGIFVMAGKPVHAGHWKMIERMAKEQDRAYVFVSTGDRGNVKASVTLKVWKDYLLDRLPDNVTVRFEKSPAVSATYEVAAFQREPISFCFYTDVEDAENSEGRELLHKSFSSQHRLGSVTTKSACRQDTFPISGTMMREYLEVGDKERFVDGLPGCLSTRERDEVWMMFRGSL